MIAISRKNTVHRTILSFQPLSALIFGSLESSVSIATLLIHDNPVQKERKQITSLSDEVSGACAPACCETPTATMHCHHAIVAFRRFAKMSLTFVYLSITPCSRILTAHKLRCYALSMKSTLECLHQHGSRWLSEGSDTPVISGDRTSRQCTV